MTSGSSGGFADGGTTKPPGCGQKDDGTFCDCLDVPLFAEAPNIYFVLDRSGSMAEDNKWGQVRQVVAQILRGLGPRANFGATLFPGFDDSSPCSPPVAALPISPGRSPWRDGRTDDEEAAHRDAEPTERRHAHGGGPARRASAPARREGQDVRHPRDRRRAQLQRGARRATAGTCQPNIEGVQGCPAARSELLRAAERLPRVVPRQRRDHERRRRAQGGGHSCLRGRPAGHEHACVRELARRARGGRRHGATRVAEVLQGRRPRTTTCCSPRSRRSPRRSSRPASSSSRRRRRRRTR